MNADRWIQRLNLKEHPEGGFYSEVYRNTKNINFVSGTRSLATSIYFLLKGYDKSHFHQLFSDELWYFHAGSSVMVHKLFKGEVSQEILGIGTRENPQIFIKAGTVFGAEVMDKDSYCLMSCMVNPGFDFRDFRLIKRKELYRNYPDHYELIDAFTFD